MKSKSVRILLGLVLGLCFSILVFGIYKSLQPDPRMVRLAASLGSSVDDMTALKAIEAKVDDKSYNIPQDIETLARLLKSDSESIKFSTCRLLGFIGKVKETDLCANLLVGAAEDSKESDDVRFKALHALDKIDHDKAMVVAQKYSSKPLAGKFGTAVAQLLEGGRVDFATPISK